MAHTGSSSSFSLPSTSKKVATPAKDSSSSTSTSDPNAMAIAPYIPPSSLFSDFNLPFSTGDGGTSLWDFGNDDANGGLSFVTGSQLNNQKDGITNNLNSNTVADKGGTVKDTNESSNASQIPSHIAKNNPFLNKLRSMVDDPATNDLITWSKDGETFLVPNHVKFGDEVLPRFFKHNRFSSFVRQLNMYGFHKVPHLQQGALKSDPGQENELWEFQNDNFKRDRPELLLNMQRKKGVRNEDENGRSRVKDSEIGIDGTSPLNDVTGALTRSGKADNETSLMQLATVWSAIQSIQAAQQGINDNLRHLHNTNNELFREAAEQRARSQKQDETINKMLRFLAGVFGAQEIGGDKRSTQGSANAGSTGGDDRRRRVVIRPNFSKNAGGRLMIGNATSGDGALGDQFEELEVPMDDETETSANIEELPAMSQSNSNSPSGGTTPINRFTSSNNSPESNPHELPSISSDVTATPGGNRKISQQAGAQILNALTNGEGNAWLANLFGQQAAPQQNTNNASSGYTSDKTASTSSNSNNSFKLDAQTLATLQSVLGNMSNVDTTAAAPGAQDSYFGTSSSTPKTSTTTPRVSNAITPLYDGGQAARVTRNQQNIQGTSQDVALVQNALNALVEGLKTDNLGKADDTMTTRSGQERSAKGSSTASVKGDESADVDMDSLLKEFLEAGSSTDTALSPSALENGLDRESGGDADTSSLPDFAFEAPSQSNGLHAPIVKEQGITPLKGLNGVKEGAPNTIASPATGKKRKPAEFENALIEDIERANSKAAKYTKSSDVK